MLSLLYVSRPTSDGGRRTAMLDDIQAISIARNSRLGITGLLIATAAHFAQLLEGPSTAIDAVMASILADPGHRDIRIIRCIPTNVRRYPQWAMARFDAGSFGSSRTDPLLAACLAGDDGEAAARLDRLIDAIARGRVAQRS